MGGVSQITAGQAGATGPGRRQRDTEVLEAKVENGTVGGGGRLPRVREKHGMALCKKDMPGQFVSL